MQISERAAKWMAMGLFTSAMIVAVMLFTVMFVGYFW